MHELIEKGKVKNSYHPHVGIMLTYACNMRCKGCLAGIDRPGTIQKARFITKPIIHTIIEQLHQMPERFDGKIMITGGEPTLHAEFIEICTIFADEKFTVRFSTNGSFVELDTPIAQQSKSMAIFNLLKRSNISMKLPIDKMYTDALATLPQRINKIDQFLTQNGFVYGQDYIYGIIADNLNEIVDSAVRCGLTINKQNAMGLIRDWRPFLDVENMAEVVNFLQIGPEGNVYQNYHKMLRSEVLGDVHQLKNIILRMAQRISTKDGIVLKHKDINGNWNELAERLVDIYQSRIR